ncbi:MAG: hypothetical protein HYW48_10165 [Deltaproteobacteria bacterium]|nr:hypothetical protein [Deltaproteobacteria bacterium]
MEEPAAQFPPNHLLAPHALRVTRMLGKEILIIWQVQFSNGREFRSFARFFQALPNVLSTFACRKCGAMWVATLWQ